MNSEIIQITLWWVMLFSIGVAGLPLASLVFGKFPDRGYAFSKILSILLISYAVLLLSITGVATFTLSTILLVLTGYAAFNFYLIKKNPEITKRFVNKKKLLIKEEMLFIVGLTFWSYIRAHQPDIRGLEKFMDFGFINSALNTQYLPPPDMWFAGETINYYWFGHFVVALLTKLSGIVPSITYNLMLGTILGLSMSCAFSFVYTLIYNLKLILNRRVIVAGALVSAILLNFAGNFHTPYYLLKDGRDNYWYPNATRFIGYNPEVDDKTIHEFPLYSYVVADLHAHLINLPFVLLYIAVLYTFVVERKNEKGSKKLKTLNSKQYPKSKYPNYKFFRKLEIRNWNLFRISDLGFGISYKLVLLGLILGIMFMTSTWDFGNYLLLSGFVFLVFNLRKYSFSIKTVIESAKDGFMIMALGLIFALPFILSFESIAEGVGVVHTSSLLWQLALLWGMPAILIITLGITFKELGLKNLKKEDLFIASMLISSLALIVIPEIIYVKDIYIASHYRANTMFKLTYQAFVMSYLASGYVAVRVIHAQRKMLRRYLMFTIFAAAFTSVMTYPGIAIKSYYEGLQNYRGLDGELWLKNQYPEYY